MNAANTLYSFTGFRSFLVAHAEDRRARSRGWTYARWSKELGLETTASLTRVIKGSREPGPEMTERFVRYFRFSKPQAEFFRLLVQLEKTREPDLRVLILERLRNIHPSQEFRELDHRSFMAISNWYFAAVRESARLKDAPADPAAFAKALNGRVTPSEIKNAIETLIGLGLLARDADSGRLVYLGGAVDTRPDIASEATKRYIEQYLDQAKLALRETDISEHAFTGSAFAIRKDQLPKAKELIREFKSRFLDLVATRAGDGEAVYQFQVQFFPVLAGPLNREEITPREKGVRS